MQTFFITQKSLGGHAKTSVTSPLLKVVKFHAVVKLKDQMQRFLFVEVNFSPSVFNINKSI